jgi:hypothetical protein
MPELLLSDLLQIFLAALLAGILDTVVGFGGGLLLLPVLVMIVGGTDAVVLSALVPIGWNAVRMPLLRDLIDWKAIGLFMIGILPGTFLGAWGLDLVDPEALRSWIGIFLLLLGGYHVLRLYVEVPYPKISKVIAYPFVGLLAGTLTALLGAGNGPLQSWTMTAAGAIPRAVVAVNGFLGIASGAIRMVAYGWEGLLKDVPWIAGLIGLGAAVIGAVIGIRLSRRAADSTLRLLVGIAIILAGLKLTL